MNTRFYFSGLVALLLGLAAIVGCGKSTPPSAPSSATSDAGHHDHPSEGPHGGQLIELQEGAYHAELVHEDDTHTVTIYLLDDKAKGSVTSGEGELMINLVVDGGPAQFMLAAAPEPSDPKGESSKFQVVSEELSKAMDAKDVKGRLNVTIGGKPLVGAFEHADHGHDHEK
jgi:hypothetical protein